MTGIDHFLTEYGYLAIFTLLMLGIVGPLIPDETILVASGIFVHRGQLQFVPAFAAAFAGSLCGITLSYALGLFGFVWIERRWPKLYVSLETHLAKAERWFLHYGNWTLFFGYFVAGVRHFTALFAGISGMPFASFSRFAYPGAFVWVLCFLSIGYFVGDQWSKYASTVDRALLLIAAAVVLVSILVWQTRKKRR